MNKHVFRGTETHAICADCKVERLYVDLTDTMVYRVTGGVWLTVKPQCTREIPRGIASEGRP